MSNLLEKRIYDWIEPAIADLGYELVCVRIIGSKKLQTLQIMAENAQTHNLDLDGCSKISRAVSAILDVEDPFTSPYQLEVSSPGIDRPLVRATDFANHVGYEVTLESHVAAENGQKKYRGFILSFDNETIELKTDNGIYKIPFSHVEKSKLILSDELIKQKKPPQNIAESLEPHLDSDAIFLDVESEDNTSNSTERDETQKNHTE